MSQVATKVINTTFSILGLKKEHAQVYLALLKLGPSVASVVAKEAVVPRSSCYQLLADLEGVGLVSKTEANVNFIFVAQSPILLEEKLKRKQAAIQEGLQALESMSTSMSERLWGHHPDLPKIRFFQGDIGLHALYTILLNYLKLQLVHGGCLEPPWPQYFLDFRKQIQSRLLTTQEIVPHKGYLAEYHSSRTDIKASPAWAAKVRLEKIICEQAVAYINHSAKLGFIITNDEVFQIESAQFTLLWSLV